VSGGYLSFHGGINLKFMAALHAAGTLGSADMEGKILSDRHNIMWPQ
jgi:hypothetical protein